LPVNSQLYEEISSELQQKNVTLIAVSKTKPAEDIFDLYELGQRDFGENYVQELIEKYRRLPKDIRWHFIGHLQSNKVKLIAPFVHLIHSVDSEKLLKEISKEAKKNNRIIDCLLEVYIAKEETKFGLDAREIEEIIIRVSGKNNKNNANSQDENPFQNICIKGLMGMASFTDNKEIVRREFHFLKSLFDKLKTKNSELQTISMGMSADYKMAIEEESNMVRIGSLLFGKRKPKGE
jgi:hypothetical protein